MFPQLSAAVRVFLCTKPTDMRKGFDGLFGMVQEFLGQDPPLRPHFRFCFSIARRDRVKVLFWERDGLVVSGTSDSRAGHFKTRSQAASVSITNRGKPASELQPNGPGLAPGRHRRDPFTAQAAVNATPARVEPRIENILELSNIHAPS